MLRLEVEMESVKYRVRPELTSEGRVRGELAHGFYGSATITSNIPIAIGALTVILPDGNLLAIPIKAKFAD